MKKLLSIICVIPLLASCSGSSGFSDVDYKPVDRERYTNRFNATQIPEQWENYGIGDPYILRFNGEYYLYTSTKDGQYGYKVWKSKDLIHYSYLGLYQFLNKDGTSTNQAGQYAPEVYYWNGDFYCYGSPSGKGHYVYKSLSGLPYGDFQAITDNIGLNIDGSVFIDDDESMTFLTSGNGAINAYEMKSMSEVKTSTKTDLLSPLVKQTEGPFLMKHDDTYYLTYAGNHVKSPGYRIGYSYSNLNPFEGYIYPDNNPIALSTMSDFNGLGHSSTVLGPNLDSYYLAYHNLEDQSGPIRAFNINRIFFSHNRMSLYGPTDKPSLVPLTPDYAEYDSANLLSVNDTKLSKEETSDRFTIEYNFVGINNASKLLFSSSDNSSNYIQLDSQGIYLYVNNALIGEGTFKNKFDFTKLHSVRLAYSDGHYRVYFDNMKKIEVKDATKVGGGKVGYQNIETIGSTIFTNHAFDSSSVEDPKTLGNELYLADYLSCSKLSDANPVYEVEGDSFDNNYLYSGAQAVKLSKSGDRLVYPIDVLEDGLYGFELTYLQSSAGSRLSIQIDNQNPQIFDLKKQDFSKNMNATEDQMKFIKSMVAELEISKGLHTLKIELMKGSTELISINSFLDSKFSPDYTNDLSTYVSKGARYLSLWKLVDNDGVMCHKAKTGSNNMIIFGDETLTNYEVSVDIKVDISAATNAMAGVIVRCNNPSLYTGQIDQSAQGYFVGFNRLQLVLQKINYSSNVVGVKTGDQYTLGSWHNVKVRAEGSIITVYFDGVEHLSYVDPSPYSHGSIALYSINTESYYKNLSIKGI